MTVAPAAPHVWDSHGDGGQWPSLFTEPTPQALLGFKILILLSPHACCSDPYKYCIPVSHVVTVTLGVPP